MSNTLSALASWPSRVLTCNVTHALFIAAPASGQGKTLTTAALAWHYRQQGKQVRIFKTGPDFLDPMILAEASGNPVGNLDQFMGSPQECQRQIAAAAQYADLILVEGVMGLYDGVPSSADMAALLDMPVLLVIDAAAMAQTFGALALGLTRYDPRLTFAGVVANRVASPRHAQMLQDSLPMEVKWWGTLSHESGIALPERHLGLVQAGEIRDLQQRLALAALKLPDALKTLSALPPFTPPTTTTTDPVIQRLLAGYRLAIARDAAFSFIYPANLDTLTALGAELCFFSPLAGEPLPSCDALWLPGGYPELHLERLSAQEALRTALHQHHAQGKPLWAECGGMTYLAQRLISVEGTGAAMAGLIPGEATVQHRLSALGLQVLDTPWGELRGHTFHYSRLSTSRKPAGHARTQQDTQGEAVYRCKGLMASYLHSYFPSNPVATAHIFLGNWS